MTNQTHTPNPDSYLQELMHAESEQIRLDAERNAAIIRLDEERQASVIRLESIRKQEEKTALAEAGLTKLRTIALEFDSTLVRCTRLKAEIDAFLQPREGIDYAELAGRLESTLVPVSDWLAEFDLQSEAVRQLQAEWLDMALVTLNIRNAQTVLDQCRQKLKDARAAAEQVAKAEAERQAEDARREAEAEQQRKEQELQKTQNETQNSELTQKYVTVLITLVAHVNTYIDEGQLALWPDALTNVGSYASYHPPVVKGLQTLNDFKKGLVNLPPVPESLAQRQALIIAIRDLERLRGLMNKNGDYWAIGWAMHMSVHTITNSFPSDAPSFIYFDETGREMSRSYSYFDLHHPRIIEGFKQLLTLARQLPVVDEEP
jgi:hypothetical protein